MGYLSQMKMKYIVQIGFATFVSTMAYFTHGLVNSVLHIISQISSVAKCQAEIISCHFNSLWCESTKE